MDILVVNIRVKPESLEAFRQATLENARGSIQEPGIARFDVLQQKDDPTHFLLIEVYRTPEGPARHKETAHYKTWNQVTAEMLAKPRTRAMFTNVFPDERGWA